MVALGKVVIGEYFEGEEDAAEANCALLHESESAYLGDVFEEPGDADHGDGGGSGEVEEEGSEVGAPETSLELAAFPEEGDHVVVEMHVVGVHELGGEESPPLPAVPDASGLEAVAKGLAWVELRQESQKDGGLADDGGEGDGRDLIQANRRQLPAQQQHTQLPASPTPAATHTHSARGTLATRTRLNYCRMKTLLSVRNSVENRMRSDCSLNGLMLTVAK